jgi:predicted TIM-barrel fold metal-dependent hydrolase
MTITRRDALAAGAGFALLGCAGPQEADAKMLPLIDTHQHLWDLDRFRLPWLKRGEGKLGRSFVMKDYLEATAGTGIAGAVYMEVDVAADQKVQEAEELIRICETPGSVTRGAVVGGRPAEPGFSAYLDRFKGVRWIKGVRQVMNDAVPGMCLKEDFVAGVRELGRRGLSFDLCLPPGLLGDAAELAARCPETRFVLDHCGNADPKAFQPGAKPSHDPEAWKRGIARLAAAKNVIGKISGIVARVPETPWEPSLLAPVVDVCLDAFGPDRVVFGSDWPVCLMGAPLARWVEALRAVVARRPVDQQRKLFSENAVRFYGLA